MNRRGFLRSCLIGSAMVAWRPDLLYAAPRFAVPGADLTYWYVLRYENLTTGGIEYCRTDDVFPMLPSIRRHPPGHVFLGWLSMASNQEWHLSLADHGPDATVASGIRKHIEAKVQTVYE